MRVLRGFRFLHYLRTLEPSEQPHKNRACHDWRECNVTSMFRRLAFGHLYAIYLAQNLDIYHRCMSTVHQPLRCTLLYIHRDSEYFWNSVGENAEFLTRSADKIVCGTLKFTYNTRLQIKILLFSGLEYIRL